MMMIKMRPIITCDAGEQSNFPPWAAPISNRHLLVMMRMMVMMVMMKIDDDDDEHN